jgi:hypothetical protein
MFSQHSRKEHHGLNIAQCDGMSFFGARAKAKSKRTDELTTPKTKKKEKESKS